MTNFQHLRVFLALILMTNIANSYFLNSYGPIYNPHSASCPYHNINQYQFPHNYANHYRDQYNNNVYLHPSYCSPNNYAPPLPVPPVPSYLRNSYRQINEVPTTPAQVVIGDVNKISTPNFLYGTSFSRPIPSLGNLDQRMNNLREYHNGRFNNRMGYVQN